MCEKHSCDKNMLLVKTIGKFPCLYNSNLTEYLLKDVTDKAWKEVANQTQLPVIECKEKWKNLRYGLLRSLRPNPDGSVKKKYYLHDEMKFIIPHMKISRLNGHTVAPLGDEDDEEINFNEHENVDATIAQQSFEYECVTEPLRKRSRKLEYHNHISSDNSNSDDNHENPRRMFLLSLLPEVQELSESQMRVFRRKVLEILDDCLESPNRYDLISWQNKESHIQNEAIKSEPL